MSYKNFTNQQDATSDCFREAVCIDADRIYDSCSDKECLEDLRVYFTETDQTTIIDLATNIKCKSATVLHVFTDIERIPFNNGFYSVDMTYYFLVTVCAYLGNCTSATTVYGLATFCKKVILYGSEGRVKSFNSNIPCVAPEASGGLCFEKINTPNANVQVVDPIVLSTCFKDQKCVCGDSIICIPDCISSQFEGEFQFTAGLKNIYVTLGIFTIVSLQRNVQMMIPVYDFCVPDKDCSGGCNDDPCELFKKIKFPIDEFFPPRIEDEECEKLPDFEG